MSEADRFIVGTGRCGSTLLSRMVRNHPDVLEISEFFNGLDWNRRFSSERFSGDEFLSLVSAPQPFISMAMQRGYLPEEVTYPFEKPGSRYSPRESIPWILAATLPPMADDPDDLYLAVSDFLRSQPMRRPASHARALFEWLTSRFGKTCWVERSAAAIVYVEDLAREFPNAKFLHLHRNGQDAAMSMREHAVFRLAVMLTFDVPLGEAIPEGIVNLEVNSDHIADLLGSNPPAHYFGRWWSEQLLAGSRGLRTVDAAQYHELALEDLLNDPHRSLAQLAEFLELPEAPTDWSQRAEELIARDRGSRRRPNDDGALAEACYWGNRLLGREN